MDMKVIFSSDNLLRFIRQYKKTLRNMEKRHQSQSQDMKNLQEWSENSWSWIVHLGSLVTKEQE